MASSTSKIRFGILGTASIARALIGQAFEHVVLSAVASRTMGKANAFADEAGIEKRYGSYAELFADSSIDAVYVPLPQHLHCEFAIKAAEAGKHVIVEKPAGLNSAEVAAMSAACKSNRVLFMEALMYRFKRAHNRAKELVAEGTIGRLRFINFSWSHNIENRGHAGFRLERALGGGCLLDLGVYGVDWIRFVTGAEPLLLNAYVHRREPDGLNVFAHATYTIDGILACMTCGFTTDANYYFLSGEKGSIYSPVALSGRVLPNNLHIHLLAADKNHVEHFPAENAYVLELDYFAQCIKQKRPPFLDGDNAIRNLNLIEEIAAHALPI